MNELAAVDIAEVLGVLTGFGLVVVVPLVAIMLSHQRKMAEILRGNQELRGVADERIMRLEQEVGQLRQLLTDNIIEIDDRREVQKRLTPPPPPLQSHEN